MPRKATGSYYEKRGDLFVSVTVARGKTGRMSAKLATRDDAMARARATSIAEAVGRLRKASIPRESIATLVTDMAAASPARFVGALKIVDEMCAAHESVDPDVLTFGDIAKAWTKGELHKKYPAHVKEIDQEINKMRLDKHILPTVREVPITLFTLEHAERVMRQPDLPAGSHRHVAQLVTRICNLAVYPLKAIKVSPIPRGWLPKPNTKKAGSFLYPDEDAALLACRQIELGQRILIGFLDREGTRKSEAVALEWSDIDLVRGAVNLDENKTDDPRAWKLDPGVTDALRWWRTQRPNARLVFGDDADQPRNVDHLADDLRDALKRAGVDRPALFESSKSRMQLRAHDLRSTFITLSLANGKSESWVSDRTGHKSSTMINNYKRAARMVSELELGALLPLAKALPEVSAIVDALVTGGGSGDDSSGKQVVRRKGLEPSSLSALEPKADQEAPVVPETALSPNDGNAIGDQTATSKQGVDDSATIRRLRRTPLGRACVEAVDAALSGDATAIGRSMFRLGEAHGGLRRGPSKRRRAGAGGAP